ncbi:amidohydrolase family protein [Rhodococcus aerolatus]
MRLDGVTGARVIDQDEPWSSAITRGEWADGDPSGELLDVGGRVVLPGLVDAHTHLDKAFLADELEEMGIEADGLTEAIDAVKQFKEAKGADVDGMLARAERALTGMQRAGTVAARAHAEVDPVTGLDPVTAQVELARQWAGRVDLQLVAFPQNGLEDDGAKELLLAGLDAGCTVVGACPYVDDDPAAHIAWAADVAVDRGLPLDLHLDFSDDAGDGWVDELLRVVDDRGLHGRVTVGHMTALSAAPRADAARRADGLARTRTGLVSLPATDTYLNGRGDARPSSRGIAPVRELLDAGVAVSFATNNLQNPFTPTGTGDLLDIGRLAVLLGHFGTWPDQQQVLTALTATPASVLGHAGWGLHPGAPASAVVLDTDDPRQVLRGRPEVWAVVHRGELTVPPR